MKFNGAIVKAKDDKHIGVAVADATFLDLSVEERISWIKRYATGFDNKVPVVMLLVYPDGEEKFYGRPDLQELLADIPLTYMTWKTYNTKDDA